jgi:hypothetical protein
MGTIREALESAAEGLETGDDGGAPAEVEAAPPAPSEGGDEAAAPLASADESAADDAGATPEEKPAAKPGEAGRSRDASGRFAQGAKAPATVKGRPLGIGTPVKPLPTGPTLTPAPGTPGAAPAPGTEAAKPPPAVDGPKPPPQWKPAARQAWEQLPPAVRAEVTRVESDTKRALAEASHARQFTSNFNQSIAPYAGMMQAEGGPVNFIGGLLQTAQALRTAPPAHRAQVVANIVRQFGVPIEALDAALAGQPVPQGQGQQAQAQQQPQGEIRDPRFDQFLASLQQRQQQKAQSDIEAFSQQAEFLNDVKPHMAILLQEAAQRGQAMTLQEAYERACWADPEVRVYFQQREAAKVANAQAASTQRARAAASSVKGRPAGSTTAPASSSIRGALEAAAARLSGR